MDDFELPIRGSILDDDIGVQLPTVNEILSGERTELDEDTNSLVHQMAIARMANIVLTSRWKEFCETISDHLDMAELGKSSTCEIVVEMNRYLEFITLNFAPEVQAFSMRFLLIQNKNFPFHSLKARPAFSENLNKFMQI